MSSSQPAPPARRRLGGLAARRAARTVAKTFRSRVPALVVSGAFDPVTPPRMGALMAKNLVHNRHVIIANASYSFARLSGCVDVMMAKSVSGRARSAACAIRSGEGGQELCGGDCAAAVQ